MAQPSRKIVYPLDTRPIKVIDFYTNSTETGMRIEWTTEDTAYSWLETEILSSYTRGYRRFFFNLPAGNNPLNSKYTASIWNPLADWQKNLIKGQISSLMSSHIALGCEFGIIAGFYIDDVDSQEEINPRVPTLDSRSDVSFFYSNWKEWIHTGITGFASYHSAVENEYASLYKLSNVLWMRGIKTWGKTLPINSLGLLDQNRLATLGWMSPWSDLRYLENIHGSQNIKGMYYEVIIEMHNDNEIPGIGEVIFPFSSSDVISLLNRGFLVASWGNTEEQETVIMNAYKSIYETTTSSATE